MLTFLRARIFWKRSGPSGITGPTLRASAASVLIVAIAGLAPIAAEAALVDLAVTTSRPFVVPGGSGTLTISVLNNGEPGTGAVQATLATPPYVNVSRTEPLPPGCRFLYQNLDRVVPEIVQCTAFAVEPGRPQTFLIAVEVHPRVPPGTTTGTVNVVPAPGGPDIEVNVNNNRATTGVIVGRVADPAGAIQRVNLALTGDYPALGGPRPVTQTLVVHNNGPAMTTAPLTMTYTTPFFVNIDRTRPLPAACHFLLENLAPNVPEIVQCAIPAGMTAGTSRTFELPLTQIPGSIVGSNNGIATVRTDDTAGDLDPDRSDNGSLAVALSLQPPTPATSARAVTHEAAAGLEDFLPRRAGRLFVDAAERVPEPALLAGMPQRGARIDLTLAFNSPLGEPGRTTVQQIFIGNRGEDATGPMRLVYVLPLFVNVDRTQPLPGACQFLFENPDFTVNEIIECVMPAPRSGETVSLVMPVVLSRTTPVVSGIVAYISVAPASGSNDVEQFMPDNLSGASIRMIGQTPPIAPGGNRVDLYVSPVLPNLLTNRPGAAIFRIGNKGPQPTRGPTRLTFGTPPFVNIDRARGLPAGCQFLYENTDPLVAEIVECLIPAPIAVGAEVALTIPYVLLPGGPPGLQLGPTIVRPPPGSADTEVAIIDNHVSHGVVASALPPHTLRLFLHGTDVPGTAGGFTMNAAPASSLLSLRLLSQTRWFSDPVMLGTLDETATFQVVTPCVLGLGIGGTYTLAITDATGGAVRELGRVTVPLSLCLGQQRVTLPVVPPVPVTGERLKLTIADTLGLTLQLGSTTYFEVTGFRGTP